MLTGLRRAYPKRFPGKGDVILKITRCLKSKKGSFLASQRRHGLLVCLESNLIEMLFGNKIL